MSSPHAISTKKSELFEKSTQGRLNLALKVLTKRFDADFPAFLQAVEAYQARLQALSTAGTTMSEHLHQVGERHSDSREGQAWSELGRELKRVEQDRVKLARKLQTDFLQPMKALLEQEEHDFNKMVKKIRSTIQKYEADIAAMVQKLDRDRVHGTDVMLTNLAALTRKTQEFDAKNVEMLRELQQSQQKQYIQWSNTWHAALKAELAYHEAMEKSLAPLQPLWSGAAGIDLPATTPAKAPPPVPDAAEADGGDAGAEADTAQKKAASPRADKASKRSKRKSIDIKN